MLRVTILMFIALLLSQRPAVAQGPTYHRGRTMTPEEAKAWDTTVGPAGKELPPGSGTAKEGKSVWMRRCAECHGADGKYQWPYRLHGPSGGKGPMLVGEADEPASSNIWDYVKGKGVVRDRAFATTIWDYINRGMPLGEQSGTLTPNEVYGLTAYLLYLNGIIREDEVMNATTLPKVHMPHGPKTK